MQSWFIYILVISLLGKNSSAQIVTRYIGTVSGVPVTDRFPNPDATCDRNGCTQANGYKECLDCCYCRCNDGSYWSAAKTCMDDDTIAKDCELVLGANAYKGYVVATSSEKLGNGETIYYCLNSWDQCTTKVDKCIINRERTFYESNGWKILWPNSSDVDFKIERKPGSSNILLWKKEKCAASKYDGLLLSLGITCIANGRSVQSCLALKVSGSYQIGSRPLLRTNCSKPITAEVTQTTSSTKKVSTTPNSTTPNATTLQETTTTATSTTAKPSTKEELTTKQTSDKPTSNLMMSSTQRPLASTKFSTETVKPNVTLSSRMIRNNSLTSANTKVTLISTTPSNGFGEERKSDTNSKNVVIAAASLSSAALLLIVFVVVAVCSFMKRRRNSAAGHKKFTSQNELVISDPLPLSTSTAVLEDGSNDDNNSRFWTINGDGEFTVARRPPLYSLRLKREACSLDEGVYDEPITDRKNSCNKLYAVVNKKNRQEKTSGDLGDVIERVHDPQPPLPSDVAHRDAASSQLPNRNEPIYDEPDIVVTNAVGSEQSNSHPNEPIYMLYEPFPDNHDTS